MLGIFLFVSYANANSLNFYFSKTDTIHNLCPDSIVCQNSDMAQFDCRSQSFSTQLTQGDSLHFVFIVYTRQDFRIMACSESSLGTVSYQIVEPVRDIAYKIKKTNENEEIIYKLDEYGEQILGSDDKPVILSKEILRDTIWDKRVTVKETVLFDSEKSDGKNYYDIINNDRTKRLMIKLKVNGSDKNVTGCVSILVGRKYSNPFNISGKE